MSARTRLVIALVLSCAVYLIPLVGPHAFLLLGEFVWRSLTQGGRPAAWMALEVGAALGLQLVAGATWYWILGHVRSFRPLVLVAVVPLSVVFANHFYLSLLPAQFMIERERGVEQDTWAVTCTAPNESLAVAGRKPSIVREPGDPTFVQNATGRFARLMIGSAADGRTTCEVVSLGLPAQTANLGAVFIGDRGHALLQRIDQKSGALSWEWMPAVAAPPVPLPEPPGRRSGDGGPIVAADGSVAAWLVTQPDSGQPPRVSIVVKPLASGAAPETTIPIPFELDGFVLLDLDPTAREVLLAISERTFATVGYDGAVRWGPLKPEGVQPLSNTFRRVGAGWVAWDGYKDEDGYVIVWMLGAARGEYRVPRGRGITDVAIAPGGRFIAFSTSTTLSIGSVQDAVIVLRASDGAEVFRKSLPRYTRSTVAFPSKELFAYSEWDGTRAEVRVLRIDAPLLR